MAYDAKDPRKFDHIWTEFRNKMRQDRLELDDFTAEMQPFLSAFLCGPERERRREKFLSAPYEVLDGTEKQSVILHCTDDDYRFDFLQFGNAWKLSFLECITLPVADIYALPYTDFEALPDKEAQIRSEKELSRLEYPPGDHRPSGISAFQPQAKSICTNFFPFGSMHSDFFISR